MAEVKVAENAGFCFGVKLAADKIEAALKRGDTTRLFTLGHLIHNAVYNKRLAEAGVHAVTLEEIAEIAPTATKERPVCLFVRAHGIPVETETRLAELCRENPNFSFEDCTCPHVKKIHRIAKEQTYQKNAAQGDQNCFFPAQFIQDKDHYDVGQTHFNAGNRHKGRKLTFDKGQNHRQGDGQCQQHHFA